MASLFWVVTLVSAWTGQRTLPYLPIAGVKINVRSSSRRVESNPQYTDNAHGTRGKKRRGEPCRGLAKGGALDGIDAYRLPGFAVLRYARAMNFTVCLFS